MLIHGKSHSRDKSGNSRVSIETPNFARVRTFTCVIGVGSTAGREGGGAITGQTGRHSGTPSPPAGRVRGERDQGSAMAIDPRTMRRGITASPVGRHWTIGQRRGRDGRVKRRAAAGSPAPWCTCQQADVQHGGTRSLTGCRVWETPGPPSDAAGRSADITGGRHI